MGNKKTRIKKCKVCCSKIKVTRKQHSGMFVEPHLRKNPRTFSYDESKDGVCFTPKKNSLGIWFCNSCWDQIISKVKTQD